MNYIDNLRVVLLGGAIVTGEIVGAIVLTLAVICVDEYIKMVREARAERRQRSAVVKLKKVA